MKIGSKNLRVREIGGKITVFDCGEGTTFGFSHWEVKNIRGREIGIPLYIVLFLINFQATDTSIATVVI